MAQQVKPPNQSVEGTINVNQDQPQNTTPPTPENQPPGQARAAAPSQTEPPKQKPQTAAQPSPSQPSSPPPVKRSPFRFIIPILLILIVLAAGAYALNRFVLNPSSGQPEAVTITYWGLWEPTEVMDQDFSQCDPPPPGVTVNYQQQAYQDYRERLQNALASGEGPDVFRFHHTWVPMIGAQLSPVPSDIYTQDEFTQAFYPVAGEWLRSGGDIVGIPLMFDGLALFYNVDILEAAGVSPPETWDELRRTAKQLTVTQDDRILRGGVAMGTTGNVEHWSDILGLMLLQNSADLAQPNNQLGQDAVTFYTIFSRTDRIWDDTLPSSTFAFATEKAVMMIAPSWRAHDVANINPELNFATAPAPQLPETNINWASFWAEGVSASSPNKNKEMAWKLLQFMSTKETLRQFYSAASDSPGRLFGEPFPRPDLADQLTGDPLVGSYILQAPTAQSWYVSSYTHDNGLNDQIIKYYEDAVNAVNQGEAPQRALSPAEDGIRQVLDRYGIRP